MKTPQQIAQMANVTQTLVSLSRLAIMTEPSMPPRDVMVAIVGAAATLLAGMAKPGGDAKAFSADLGHMLSEGVHTSIQQLAEERRYGELRVENVAARILAGEQLSDREAEFALAMDLIDREGKMPPFARAFWEGGR